MNAGCLADVHDLPITVSFKDDDCNDDDEDDEGDDGEDVHDLSVVGDDQGNVDFYFKF